MIEVIAITVFVFVVVVVKGWRMIDEANARKARLEVERMGRVAGRAKRIDYTGPRYNAYGRETN